MDGQIDTDDGPIAVHIARPRLRTGGRRPGLVVCHGFPASEGGAAHTGATYPELADWLADETNWAVAAFNFRGAGQSPGQFSLAGWLADLRAVVGHLAADPEVAGVWVAGFRDGASLALCLAGEDPNIRGVAALAAKVDFERWATDAKRFLDLARRIGVITDRTFPADHDAWAKELRELKPLSAAAAIPPRPFLVVHGTDDDVVPIVEARALADAASNQVEFRVLNGAGHHLRHDPRAIAILLGWLERQHI